jgi:2-keto-4-pentenoate hydratase
MTPEQLLHYSDHATLWPADAQASLPSSMAPAYQSALAVRRLRQARGELPRGYKIGFTNRNIWPLYQVFGPIWGTVYDSSLRFCSGQAALDLSRCCQPRLEPEVVFGMKATPPVGASLEALWKFSASMTVADGGLHSQLLVGRQTAIGDVAKSANDFNAVLSGCAVSLTKNGQEVEQGVGGNVLGGPLLALHYFLQELRQCPGAPDLLAGDVVTTGTWTDAWPVQPGDTWRADFAAPLNALTATFT